MINVKCQFCGKEFIVSPPARLKTGRGKYCSKNCMDKAMSIHQVGTRLGATNPSWKGGKKELTCPVCGKVFYAYEWTKGKYPIYCSMKCRAERQKGNGNSNYKEKITRHCKICGKLFQVIPAIAKRAGIFCSHKCQSTWNAKHSHTKNTDIEQILERWLQDKAIKYESQKVISVEEYKTIIDFFIEPNIWIFTDGNYWHFIPRSWKRDKLIKKALIQNGYLVGCCQHQVIMFFTGYS